MAQIVFKHRQADAAAMKTLGAAAKYTCAHIPIAHAQQLHTIITMAQSNRSLHFQFSDPLSREAASRSTRYRHLKRRRINEGREGVCDEAVAGIDPSDNGDNGTGGSSAMEMDMADLLEVYQSTPPSSVNVEGHSEDFLAELLPEEFAIDPPTDTLSDHDSDAGDNEVDGAESQAEDLVFSNCPITKSTSNLLILQYATRHNLTQEALADLLSLLSIHCPSPNIVPPSVYSFQKHFSFLYPNITLHYFCSKCLQQVPGKAVSACPNTNCGGSLQEFRALSSFFEVPIEAQISHLLERKYNSPLCHQDWHESTCSAPSNDGMGVEVPPPFAQSLGD